MCWCAVKKLLTHSPPHLQPSQLSLLPSRDFNASAPSLHREATQSSVYSIYADQYNVRSMQLKTINRLISPRWRERLEASRHATHTHTHIFSFSRSYCTQYGQKVQDLGSARPPTDRALFRAHTTHLATEALLPPRHVLGTASQYTCATKTLRRLYNSFRHELKTYRF